MSVYIVSDYLGEEYAMTHPRVAWNSVARRGTITASSEVAGFAAINAGDAREDSKWRPGSVPATWQVQADSPEPISALCLANHDFGTVGASFQVQDSADGGTWANVSEVISPADDSELMVLFPRQTREWVRIEVTGAVPTVAVVFFSDVIEIPREVFGAVATPVHQAREVEYENNRSLGGKWVGRSIKRARNYNDFEVSHLRRTWYDEVMEPFVIDADTSPYFLAENPQDDPRAISYRWKQAAIIPERMGVKNYLMVVL